MALLGNFTSSIYQEGCAVIYTILNWQLFIFWSFTSALLTFYDLDEKVVVGQRDFILIGSESYKYLHSVCNHAWLD